MKKKQIDVYTDGAYSSLRKQGGVGVIILEDGKKLGQFSKMFKNGTNNTAELKAIIIGLRCIKDSVEKINIYSDSQYCIGCAILGWKRKKNNYLWEIFDKEFERVSNLCSDINFIHIKGHQKNSEDINVYYNNLVDKLANQASQQI